MQAQSGWMWTRRMKAFAVLRGGIFYACDFPLRRRQLFFLQSRQRSSAHHWQKKQSLQSCFFGVSGCGAGT